ncbi:hypothetical protein FRC07_004908 [Ceratobasidium sp. 392]|nr:hypothetical protein FRC07_004908 [Ceratobasidium sp. 392]
MEVDHLRPGTKLPSSVTLSRDIKAIHAKYIPKVRDYFQTVKGAVHFALDGWTSPISESYLGIVAVWYDALKIHRCILEFIRLRSSHTGDYLAQNVAACIKRYGLEHKAFMLPFTRPSKRTKAVLDRHAAEARSPAAQDFVQAQQLSQAQEGDDLDTVDSADIDEAKFEHDTLVVQSLVLKAIEQLSAEHSVALTKAQLKNAQSVMPIVAGLAKRVDESPVLKIKFQETILLFAVLKDQSRKSLSRRVATRWNSDRKALDDHLHLKQPVQRFTSEPDLKLRHLALNEEQWVLGEELNDALEVFDLPTQEFSEGGVPLAHKVLPRFVELKESLENDQSIDWICNMISTRFKVLYASSLDSEAAETHQQSSKPRNRWLAVTHDEEDLDSDSIDSYMHSKTIDLRPYGGLLPYWEAMLTSKPRLARMALNYLSAPATSVDAERAFSAGRLTINHLQHNMSPATFEAKMAVGSWYGTPLLPDVSEVASVIAETM